MMWKNAASAARRLLAALSVIFTTAGLAQAAPLKVVATFSILGDMTSEIGGDAVRVRTLVGPGDDPHVYQPSPGDAMALKDADLVVVNGLGLEGWIDRLVAVSGYKGRVVVASDGVEPLVLTERDRRTTDPHAWQDIGNGLRYVSNIARALGQAAPADAALFSSRAVRLTGELTDLDGWVRRQIGDVPEKRRKIITSHDAFGYFAKAYGVTFLAPLGLSTDAEPTPAGLAKLIRQIRSENIRVLFIETMTDPRLVTELAREAKAELGPALYSDTLSPQGGPADSYARMFTHNVAVMVTAMQRE